MSNYQRVLPRDLFNEAKLLKCLGFICLHIHDNKISNMHFVFNGDAFNIEQNITGDLFVSNLDFYFNNSMINAQFVGPNNSKANFPLEFYFDLYTTYPVFNEDGSYTVEFTKYIETEGNEIE